MRCESTDNTDYQGFLFSGIAAWWLKKVLYFTAWVLVQRKEIILKTYPVPTVLRRFVHKSDAWTSTIHPECEFKNCLNGIARTSFNTYNFNYFFNLSWLVSKTCYVHAQIHILFRRLRMKKEELSVWLDSVQPQLKWDITLSTGERPKNGYVVCGRCYVVLEKAVMWKGNSEDKKG